MFWFAFIARKQLVEHASPFTPLVSVGHTDAFVTSGFHHLLITFMTKPPCNLNNQALISLLEEATK